MEMAEDPRLVFEGDAFSMLLFIEGIWGGWEGGGREGGGGGGGGGGGERLAAAGRLAFCRNNCIRLGGCG